MVAERPRREAEALEGKTIAEIATAEKKDPRDVVIDVVLADRANAGCIISIMDEADVRAALAHPLVSFGTDSGAQARRTGFFARRARTRGAGAPRRGSSATTCATRRCCGWRRRSAR